MRRASLTTMLAALVFANACASAGGTAGGASSGGGGGFRVGAAIAPTTVSPELGEDVSGTGFGVMLGYGFSRNVALYASVDAAPLEAEGAEGEGASDGSHLDLGAEYAFDAPGRRFVPYVRGGFSTLVLYAEYCDAFGCSSYDADGSGFAIGGGVRFFATSALALDLGADFGTYTLTADSDFDSTDIDVSSTRLKLGATLQFGRGDSGSEETRGGGGGPK